MMKLVLCALLALFVSASAAQAQAQAQRIATLDLRKVFDNYWRTKQANANLEAQTADIEKELKSMLDQYKKSEESYKKLLDGMNDPALSTEERDKRKKSAENELLALRSQEDRVKQFNTTSRTTLVEKQRRVRDQIVAEIKDKVRAKAKSGNYTMVLDSASESVNNTPILLYSSGESDLTDAVLADLNINAPKDISTKDSPKPAPAK
jgi:outer membrane protein